MGATIVTAAATVASADRSALFVQRSPARLTLPDRGSSLARCILAVSVPAVVLVFDNQWADSFARPKTLVTEAACVLLVMVTAISWVTGTSRDTGISTGGSLQRLPTSIVIALTTLVIVETVATVAGVDPWHSVWGEPQQLQGVVPHLMTMIAFAAAARSIITRRHLQMVMGAITVSTFVASLYAIAQRVGEDPFWNVLPNGRAFASIGQSNALGAVLVLGVCCGLALATTNRTRWPMLWASMGLVDVIGVALTFSRGAYLALAAAGLVVVAMNPPRGRRRLVLASVASGALCALTAVTLTGHGALAEVGQRVGSAVAMRSDRSTEEHAALWYVGVRIGRDNLALGIGPDNFVEIFDQYRDRVLAADVAADLAQYRPESPHNVFIARFVDAGAIALIAYVSLIAVALTHIVSAARRRRSADPLMIGVIAAIVAHGVTDSFMTGEVAGSWLAWILIGAGLGVALHAPPPEPEPARIRYTREMVMPTS
ncbi:MAG: O-antigen ligase family protein [Acidimicrobiia bacterium]